MKHCGASAGAGNLFENLFSGFLSIIIVDETSKILSRRFLRNTQQFISNDQETIGFHSSSSCRLLISTARYEKKGCNSCCNQTNGLK